MRRGLCQAGPATWLLAALLGAAPVAGQEEGATDSYLRAEQVRELELYVDSMDPGPSPEDLIILSTLLAEPSDRVTWLLDRIKTLLSAADRQGDAERLCKLTRDHVPQWEHRAAEVATLLERLDEPCRAEPAVVVITEITVPEDLRERVAEERAKPNRGGLGNLPNPDLGRFVLLARGVRPEALGLSDELAGAPVWDVPRLVLLKLAGGDGGVLPPMWELLDLEQGLRTAASAANDAGPRAPTAFRIAAALLGRAMGVDGHDRAVLQDDQPESWDGLAKDLEDENLWQWAAAARLLQAATTADDPGGAEAVEKAKAWLAKVEVVGQTDSPADSPFVATLTAWLERVREPTTPEGYLPLKRDFADRARKDRAAAEKKFIAAWDQINVSAAMNARLANGWDSNSVSEDDRNAINKAFHWMQLAKSRELGLGDDEINPLTVKAATDLLSIPFKDKWRPRVHLFLEVLEVNLTGEMSRHNGFYGLMLCSYNGSCGTDDKLVLQLIDRKQTLNEVLCEAADYLQDPPAGERTPVTQAMIFYVPDRSGRTRALEVVQAEKILWGKVGSKRDESWLLCVPSAACLAAKGTWTLERALRLWYLSQFRYASERPPNLHVLCRGGRPRGLRSPVLGETTSVYVLSVGSSYESSRPRGLFDYLMGEKTEGELSQVMVVTVSKRRTGP